MIVVENEHDLALYHHGIKGQQWGIRRYQNPDGSLTPDGRKRYMKDARWRTKYLKMKKKEQDEAARVHESKEKRTARLLESTDANELYKHRKDLSTAELQERINRIQTEQNLAKFMTHEPTKMEKAKKVVSSLVSAGESVYKFSQTPAGKMAMSTIKRNLGISSDDNVNYKYELGRINSLSNDKLSELATRAKNEKSLRETLNKLEKMKKGKDENESKSNDPLSNLSDEQKKKLLKLLEDAD